ncbi:hypothetical protein PPL_12389 [Heterostelium album PN500]|uniref:Uncharacterized protein n=1 Tax=Heterostelium pallidum (strain ATCC 26659 / Pp 5 / PN500) TaxID=670386 RepID=D3BMG9_HETP5|nr:hypothetical protein PPL_12389 [Heterostelium album PN500]EFA77181.1 hypothetical protein PPL_12389 [Heterostelium album PN500]|eukprot:XP_020429310.1 hypothetical protein PPL_12389 [Heterostelium album PN500]
MSDTHKKIKDESTISKNKYKSKFLVNPEENASNFSILTYSFMTPLLAIGVKKPLDFEDIYPLKDKTLFGRSFFWALLFKLFGDLTSFVYPLMIYKMTNYVMDPSESIWNGLFYSTIMMISYIFNTICKTHCEYLTFIAGKRIESTLTNAVYKKSLLISHTGQKDKGRGNTLNLISMDVDSAEGVFQSFQNIISMPIQTIISLVLLFNLLSWSAFVGFGSLLVFVPLNFYTTKKQYAIDDEVMNKNDKRISKVSEAINSIRVLKFYGWINMMYDNIMQLRMEEVKEKKKQSALSAVLFLFWNLIPDFVTVSTFCAYALLGNSLDMPTILAALSIFFNLRYPLSMLPHLFSNMSMTMVSIKRLETFLMNEELEKPKTNLSGSTVYGDSDPDFESKNLAVSIQEATFQWSCVKVEDEENEKQEKSSFKNSEEDTESTQESTEEDLFVLKDINLDVSIGELAVVIGPVGSGKSSLLSSLLVGGCALQGNIAYVSQLPWIMNGTLRDNILFGKEYDQQKYQNILEICELVPDLNTLPKGDLSGIGEKGINLSGGQKQRNAILPMIPKKTVILVSHQMYPLEFSDKIVTMNNGVIENICKYEEMSRETWEVYQFQNQNAKNDEEEAEEDDEEDEDESDDESEEVFFQDERNIGKVSYKLYLDYFKQVGFGYLALSTLLGILSPFMSTYGNYWLTKWSEEWQQEDHSSLFYYLGIYFLLCILMSACVFGVSLVNSFCGLNASEKYHTRALTKVLNSPIQFFDQNLSGRIINRFSKDVSSMDSSIASNLGDARDSLFNSLSVIIVIAIASPIVLVLLIPIGIAFRYLYKWFLNNAREIERLRSLALSPVLTHYSETLTGQNIIRAFGAQKRFLGMMQQRKDLHSSCSLADVFISNWAYFRLEMICVLFIVGATLSATFLRGHVSDVLIGLALSYSISLSSDLNWAFLQLSFVETEMNSVERLQHYCNLKTEKIEGKKMSPSWPENGRIRFKNFSMRYRPELPPSLNDINLEIEAGSKVGICGRTGAGKSSLLLALFRLVEADSGHIEIDNENIDQVALQDLRSKMSIIPQDPVLFAGTLRYNLDPFDTATDEELWEVIERVHLSDKIKSLDCHVSEDGVNFSVGQRQLMCLARALIRKSKIIALDEATAAVDLETDAVIQKTIREEFKDSTVITIAHRLNTIIDYDKIVLMSEGRVKQVGKPSELIELVEEKSEI